MGLVEDLLDQRARLVTREAALAARVKTLMDGLVRQWRREMVSELKGGSLSRTRVEEFARRARYLARVNAITVSEIDQIEAYLGTTIEDVYVQELRRTQYALASSVPRPAPVVGAAVSFGEVSEGAVRAAIASRLPGLDIFKSLSNIPSKVEAAMRRDLATAIADGWKLDKLISKWEAGSGAGAVRSEVASLARTSMMAASNAATADVYNGNDDIIQGVQHEATFDSRTCPRCAALHGKRYLLGNEPPLPLHPNCVLPDTVVSTGARFSSMRASYSGEIVVIRTALGHRLAVTPNHPVLTAAGFAPADSINKGDYLVCRGGRQNAVEHPHVHNRPAQAGQIFSLDSVNARFARRSVPLASVDFHGDEVRFNGHVDVVPSYGHLYFRGEAPGFQHDRERDLFGGRERHTDLPALSDLDAVLLGVRLAAYRVVGRSREARSFLGARSAHAYPHGLAAVALLDPETAHPPDDQRAGDPEPLRECLHALAAEVEIDQVVVVDREHYSGFVHDFSTASGAYVAGGIVVHNCRCVYLPVFLDPVVDREVHGAKAYSTAGAETRFRRGDRGFETWLRKQPETTRADFFPSDLKRRAWESGKITMPDLLNPDGSTKTDAQVRALVPGLKP